MAKGSMPPALMRANAIKGLLASGYSEAEAMALVDKRNGGGPARRAHGETVVPNSSGTGIRAAGRAGNLYAAVEASTVIQYDQKAIAAIWHGLFDALRTGGSVDVSALFPDPCSMAIPDSPAYAQERAMGAEMAKMIGLAIKGMDVTPAEWSQWYARSALIRVRHGADCGCGCNTQGTANTTTGPAQVGGWGSPFGPPAFSGGSSGGAGAGS